ncbi:MAG: ABC transporter ATP-binding protein [Planctomycetota bacterium]
MAAVVEVRDLEVSYGKLVALKKVSLEVHEGATGLLGPNGAGKSSLIKTLLGLVRPARGQASVLGLDVRRQSLQVRQRVGYLPERDAHIPGMTGFEYVTYCGLLTGMSRVEARRRAHEVIEYVGLGEARYRDVDGYSRGMKQRIKLAQALVHDPDLVFLDEPTNGLDPKGRLEILRLIRHISADRGLHVILSSHLLKDVEEVCPWVIVLAAGSVRAIGALHELKRDDGARAFRVRLKGEIEPYRSALEKREACAEIDERGELHVVLPPDADTRLIFVAARDAGVQVRRVVPAEETLEDIFLRALEETP